MLFLSILMAGIAFAPTACRQPPPAAATNAVLLEGERSHSLVLDSADRGLAQQAMRRAATELQPLDDEGQGPAIGAQPRTIGRGVRWSDVPLALAIACDQAGVELAIVAVHSSDDDPAGAAEQLRFELVSVDDRPAELIVRQIHDARVYQATARAGWRGEDTGRAQRLLEAFDDAMQALGRKRGFMDD